MCIDNVVFEGDPKERKRRMKKWLSDIATVVVMLVLIGICIGGGVALGFAAVLAVIM